MKILRNYTKFHVFFLYSEFKKLYLYVSQLKPQNVVSIYYWKKCLRLRSKFTLAHNSAVLPQRIRASKTIPSSHTSNHPHNFEYCCPPSTPVPQHAALLSPLCLRYHCCPLTSTGCPWRHGPSGGRVDVSGCQGSRQEKVRQSLDTWAMNYQSGPLFLCNISSYNNFT